MKRRRWYFVLAVVALFGCLCGLPLTVVITTEPNAVACQNTNNDSGVAAIDTVATGQTGKWTKQQATNAFLIAAAGQTKNVPARGWVIAVATAIQESSLKNLANPSVPESLALPHDGQGSDHDSLGLFQQRPSQGWGTPAELLDPTTAASNFYDRLITVDQWESKKLGVAAQAVQRSAFPDRYDQWEKEAEFLVAQAARVESISALDGATLVKCTTSAAVSASGWTVPVKAPIGSAFRAADRPSHDGVDLGAPRNTAIHAAADGTVTVVVCNASSNNCDVDGSPSIVGCGWYVDIRHTNDIVTRYCHMSRKPEVTVGQVVKAGEIIGFVGSSGNSSGPHLHFEVHTHVPTNQAATHATAVDPVAFMQQVNAPLGV